MGDGDFSPFVNKAATATPLVGIIVFFNVRRAVLLQDLCSHLCNRPLKRL